MLSVSEMMARVIFPGAREYRFIEKPSPAIMVPAYDPDDWNLFIRGKNLFPVDSSVEVEEVRFDCLTLDSPYVWAGWAKKANVVFIYEDEEKEEEE